jgi:hypothetical protein
MPIPRPAYLPGHYYHIYNRGAHRKSIFKEPANFLFVQRKIKQYSQQFKLTVIAYCLMPNHYHLLIRQDGEFRAGLLPQHVFNSYSKAYNKRYDHSGTLFEGNYRVKVIQTSASSCTSVAIFTATRSKMDLSATLPTGTTPTIWNLLVSEPVHFTIHNF